MLDFLRSWIINIVTISIILILFEIIIPSGKIKKIINLVSGFILLIVVINPFISLKNQDIDLGKTALTDSYYIDKKEIEAGSKLLKDTQIKQISDVYKKKLVSTIREETNRLDGVYDSKVNVAINEDYNSDKYGEITKVDIQIIKGDKKDESMKVKPVISVKKIEIKAPDISKSDQMRNNTEKGNQTVNEKQLNGADEYKDKRLIELVKQNLYKTLEIRKDAIAVTIS